MTTYRLPDWLGGRDAIHVLTANGMPVPDMDGMVHVLVATDDGDASIIVRAEDLVEVAPPLPAEPPDGETWLYMHPLGNTAFIRNDNDHRSSGDERWFGSGIDHPQRWKVLANMNGSWARLVPDPAADAPELPYVFADKDDDKFSVYPYAGCDPKIVATVAGSGYLTPEACRSAAAALLRAAQDHEQQEASRA